MSSCTSLRLSNCFHTAILKQSVQLHLIRSERDPTSRTASFRCPLSEHLAVHSAPLSPSSFLLSLRLLFSSIPWQHRAKSVSPFTNNSLQPLSLTLFHRAPAIFSSRSPRRTRRRARNCARASTSQRSFPAAFSRRFTAFRPLDGSVLFLSCSIDLSPYRNTFS